MREILFRGKRAVDGRWVEGHYFTNQNGTFIFAFPYHANYADIEIMVRVDPETVCQYTWLNDKNGKKIFEGDIVKQYADTTELGKDLYYFYTIRWNKDFAYFEGIEIYSGETFLFPDLEDCEVIGNIFDNQDLLNV